MIDAKQLTPSQIAFLKAREAEFDSVVLDIEATRAIRFAEPAARDWIAVAAALPGAGVKMWFVDAGGAVVMEGGAGPE